MGERMTRPVSKTCDGMASLSKSSSSMRPACQTLASSANSVCVVHCSEIGEKAGYDADEEAAKLFAATLLRGCPAYSGVYS